MDLFFNEWQFQASPMTEHTDLYHYLRSHGMCHMPLMTAMHRLGWSKSDADKYEKLTSPRRKEKDSAFQVAWRAQRSLKIAYHQQSAGKTFDPDRTVKILFGEVFFRARLQTGEKRREFVKNTLSDVFDITPENSVFWNKAENLKTLLDHLSVSLIGLVDTLRLTSPDERSLAEQKSVVAPVPGSAEKILDARVKRDTAMAALTYLKEHYMTSEEDEGDASCICSSCCAEKKGPFPTLSHVSDFLWEHLVSTFMTQYFPFPVRGASQSGPHQGGTIEALENETPPGDVVGHNLLGLRVVLCRGVPVVAWLRGRALDAAFSGDGSRLAGSREYAPRQIEMMGGASSARRSLNQNNFFEESQPLLKGREVALLVPQEEERNPLEQAPDLFPHRIVWNAEMHHLGGNPQSTVAGQKTLRNNNFSSSWSSAASSAAPAQDCTDAVDGIRAPTVNQIHPKVLAWLGEGWEGELGSIVQNAVSQAQEVGRTNLEFGWLEFAIGNNMQPVLQSAGNWGGDEELVEATFMGRSHFFKPGVCTSAE